MFGNGGLVVASEPRMGRKGLGRVAGPAGRAVGREPVGSESRDTPPEELRDEEGSVRKVRYTRTLGTCARRFCAQARRYSKSIKG